MREKILMYEKAWRKIEPDVFETLSQKAKRAYPYSVIHVHVVDIIDQPRTIPLIISYRESVDKFIVTLIIELIYKSWYFENESFKTGFSKESEATRKVLLLYCFFCAITVDTLKKPEYKDILVAVLPKELKKGIEQAENIVSKFGHNHILETYIKKRGMYLHPDQEYRISL
jgi:hypothetical protein